MLQFLPWCPIEERYAAGALTLLPFSRNDPNADLNEEQTKLVLSVLEEYRDLEGRPVRQAAVARYQERSILADLSEEELQICRDLADLVCFAGLAHRQFFDPLGRYCNTDAFNLYARRAPGADVVTLVARRREGTLMDLRFTDQLIFTVPLHVSGVSPVSLDQALLTSLVQAQAKYSPEDWGRWQSAISCFNQGNTDNYSVASQVEWVLMASAFEHLLDARPNAADVAGRFAEATASTKSVVARDAVRRSTRFLEAESLGYCWMEEFYRVRGDFAHGRLQPRQPMAWTENEHLVLAAIAFPLLVRQLLSKDGIYRLTPDDQAQLNVFDRFADCRFFEKPPEQQSNADWWWTRLVHEEWQDLILDEAIAEAAEELRDREGVVDPNGWN